MSITSGWFRRHWQHARSPAAEPIGLAPVLVLVLVLAPALAAAGDPPRLLYAEALDAQWLPDPARHAAGAGNPSRGTLHFQALGRAFDLELAPNAGLSGAPADVAVQAGTVRAAPGSWVRLTRHGDNLTGLIYDGAEYFGIEPVRTLAVFLDPSVPQPASGNMIYRLADLLIDPGTMACGVVTPAGAGPVSAATAVQALGRELRATSLQTVNGPSYRLKLAPIGDYEFVSRYGADSAGEILSRLNIVDGIFSGQVGVDIVANAPTLFPTAEAPYPLTATDAAGLLNQVSDYRKANHITAGLTHLFTSKSFADHVVGIAWQGAVCFPREGAGLSTSAGISAVTSGLVAAHEIGHNFGAPHDGEENSPCESTPQSYLMAPRNSGSSTFSGCSLGEMAMVIDERAAAYPACLTSIADYDVGIVAPAPARAAPGEMTDLLIKVDNLGNLGASSLDLHLSAPAALTVAGASPSAGYCDFSTSEVRCDLSSLAAGANWQVVVQVQSDQEQLYTLNASVAAAVDGAPANNSASFTVIVGNPPVAASQSGGGGGGGGTLDLLAALGMAAVALRRRFDRQRPAH